jgi:hypothetical protein
MRSGRGELSALFLRGSRFSLSGFFVHPQCIALTRRMRESALMFKASSSLSGPKEKMATQGAEIDKRRIPMKKSIFAVASLVAFCSLAATQGVRAQEAIKVDIPFAFSAGDAALPPGEYRVEKMASNGAVLLIRCAEPTASALVVTMPAGGGNQRTESKLIFHRYGNTYFLSQVWSAGSSSGRQLRKTAREKEAALSAKAEPQSQVVLYARLAPARP